MLKHRWNFMLKHFFFPRMEKNLLTKEESQRQRKTIPGEKDSMWIVLSKALNLISPIIFAILQATGRETQLDSISI